MKVSITHTAPDLSFIEIRRGDWVVVKPNLVKEQNLAHPGEWRSVVTSRDLIERVCCYVAARLAGTGRMVICDAPQTDSSFVEIAKLLDLGDLADTLTRRHSVPVSVIDLRQEEWTTVDEVVVRRKAIAGDPEGAVAFNLGRDSLFFGHGGEGRYYGADYDAGVVNRHHQGERQEYLICGSAIKCDVFINLPKLKTHKKAGVTLNLKNLVGINADKNWLPHHTEGTPESGGDQFQSASAKQTWEAHAAALARKVALRVPGLGPALVRRLRRAGKSVFGRGDEVIRSGNWYGNNTTWRMVLDLNRCLLYGNADGTLRRERPKRYYSLVDGIVGMEGNGPMAGDPVSSGIVIGGADPVAVDMVAARVMGFDWRKIPVIREAFAEHPLPITRVKPEDVEVVSDKPAWCGRFLEIEPREFLHFRPHFGWKGYIEYERKG